MHNFHEGPYFPKLAVMDAEYSSMMPVRLVLLIEAYLVSFVYIVQNMFTSDLNFKESTFLKLEKFIVIALGFLFKVVQMDFYGNWKKNIK